MRFTLVALLGVLSVLTTAGWSQAEETLSLQQAVDIALRQNPTLSAARNEVVAAKSSEKVARALANPEIVVVPSPLGNAAADDELTITQPLEINGQRRIRREIARAGTLAAEASTLTVEKYVICSVKQAYWDIARAQSVVELNAANVTLAESLHEAAKKQVDAGASPGSQLIKTQVELTRARQDLTRAESELAQSTASLNILLGRSPETPIQLAEHLNFAPMTLGVANLRSQAVANRSELAEAQALLSVRRGDIRAARVRKHPDLTLQVKQETLGGNSGIGIGIVLPIIDWGSIRHDRERAEAAAEAQSQRVEAVVNDIRLDVDSALRDVDLSDKLVRQYEQGVLSQAEQLSEMAQKGYKSGATGYLDVLEAQRTLRNVRAEYYAALADHLKALAQLEWAVGGWKSK